MGDAVGATLLEADGAPVGVEEGGRDFVGDPEGILVGGFVGEEVIGDTVGLGVGFRVGDPVVGAKVGSGVGDFDGDPVGEGIGAMVGAHENSSMQASERVVWTQLLLRFPLLGLQSWSRSQT